MKAMILKQTGSLEENPTPLQWATVADPSPRQNEILVEVSVCGVCHTELDEIEGRTPPPELPIILGHQVVGKVVALGAGATRHKIGQRVGIGWIFHSDGSDQENLSPQFKATGRDANGGYAQLMTVHENYAFPIPAAFSDLEAAPLLCAGAIGFRALRLTNIVNGAPLGLTGFGGSAHIVIQLAKHLYPDSSIHVFARDPAERKFANELGAAWSGDTGDSAPEKLQAIIDTTPAWRPVVEALRNLRPGGRLVINAIGKQDLDKDCLLELDYSSHLWMEREIKSVANITGNDIAEFLQLAAAIPVKTTVQAYGLADANQALCDLKNATVRGAKVLMVNSG